MMNNGGGGSGRGHGGGDAPSETILDIIGGDHLQTVSSPSELALLAKEEQQSPPPVVKQQKTTLSRFKVLVSVPKLFSATTGRSSKNKSAKVHALKGFKFITAAQKTSGWSKVELQFDNITANSDDHLLHCSKFGKCIGMDEKSNEFTDALFRALAKRCNISGRDSINKEELKMFWDQISNDSFDTRLQTYLAIVDKDGDGKITEEELTQMISLSASTNNLKNIHKQAKEHAALIMEKLDPENDGYIMIDNLESMLLDASNQTNDVIPSDITDNKDTKINVYRRSKLFLKDNWQREWVMILWVAVVLGLFTYKFIQFRNKAVFHVMGYCVCVAKGSGETLKLNMALVLLPVCRNTITWLRTKMKLGVAVPFDDNLNFHKVIAVGIAVGIGFHAIAHLTCDFPRLLNAGRAEYEAMKKYFGEVQPDNYWWFVTGFAGWTGIVMVILMAVAFTLATPWFRRNKLKNIPKPINRLAGFNAFWYSHHLFVIVYALLIVHGIKIYLTKTWYQKTTWMYLAVPLILYGCERLIRAFRSSIKSVEIIQAAKFEGNKTKVVALRMSKPNGFKYKSGQYMFVKCSSVSPFEWHPFSITSAPGDDYLGVHIKAGGDWTERLIAKFPEVSSHPLPIRMSGLLKTNSSYPKISIDGPYGAPAQDYSKYDVVMLVGLGIGGTPMVSIIKDIIHNNIKIKEKEDNISKPYHNPNPNPNPNLNPNPNPKGGLEIKKRFRTQKAYFYWVTPEQDCSKWFKEVMDNVAEMDTMHLIELNNYCTSVYKEDDARSALITMLQSLQYAKKGVDVVSETSVRSHFSRPDWGKVYNNIAHHHPKTRVGVFYCGAPTLTNELRNRARDFSRKTSTKFEFHKENF